ncbi:MAG TPA: hypothetical protein VF796_29385, partial [Humisphaera sp.]
HDDRLQTWAFARAVLGRPRVPTDAEVDQPERFGGPPRERGGVQLWADDLEAGGGSGRAGRFERLDRWEGRLTGEMLAVSRQLARARKELGDGRGAVAARDTAELLAARDDAEDEAVAELVEALGLDDDGADDAEGAVAAASTGVPDRVPGGGVGPGPTCMPDPSSDAPSDPAALATGTPVVPDAPVAGHGPGDPSAAGPSDRDEAPTRVAAGTRGADGAPAADPSLAVADAPAARTNPLPAAGPVGRPQ